MWGKVRVKSHYALGSLSTFSDCRATSLLLVILILNHSRHYSFLRERRKMYPVKYRCKAIQQGLDPTVPKL